MQTVGLPCGFRLQSAGESKGSTGPAAGQMFEVERTERHPAHFFADINGRYVDRLAGAGVRAGHHRAVQLGYRCTAGEAAARRAAKVLEVTAAVHVGKQTCASWSAEAPLTRAAEC